jgi:hypothetical protein
LPEAIGNLVALALPVAIADRPTPTLAY